MSVARESAEKFPGGGGATEKRPQNSKKRQKNSTINLFQGRGKDHRPAADAHGLMWYGSPLINIDSNCNADISLIIAFFMAIMIS